MTVISLIPEVRSLVGDEDTTNYRYTDNVYRDRKIPAGIRRLNLNEYKRFVVSGSGDTAVILPVPNDEEQTMMCLYAALCVLDGEITKAAHLAVTVSTPAGNTNMTNVSKELREQRKAIMEELKIYKSENMTVKIAKEIDVSDDELI
ncbi:MAG: hypothetical protein WC775_06390 [Patescibacteria group bacterium]|jgi:hypothetical protein